MILKNITDEDFVNYKKPSMVLGFPICKNFKCDKEYGQQVCQNSALATAPDIEIDDDILIKRYLDNPITESLCMQGLEPFDTPDQLFDFVRKFRQVSLDDIVIYTGYNKNEIEEYVKKLAIHHPNIIIKFGRYIPNQKTHYDKVLGVYLASDNQYAEKIS